MTSKSLASKPAPVSRAKTVTCVCDLRKKYESRISAKVKENFNKVLVMGSVDFKMMYEMFKEFDALHKEKMHSMFNKKEDRPDVVDAEPLSPDFETSSEASDDGDDNIFLKKN